ncbi:uncharacterized protein K02A2.6-like [Aricia agestis]|uniref:uncharacterized protein K02A2.6-like n=1 Tax=Aricia agestis TaxID=91739 RepID=UPI001C207F38|nr:uncharacterized protein K02A2.6-like [Aricia agestis]
MNTTSASAVIKIFREIFARFGLPSQIVTDNGPPFTSSELKSYLDRNGIVHNLTSPYRPKGNGAAENAVKTVKNCIKKAHYEGLDVERALSKMLFQYRNCEHATTGIPPAVALLGRRLRGRLDLLRFDVEERVRAKQSQQVERAGGTHRDVGVGDRVFVRDYSLRNNRKWVEGRVSEQVGPASFSVNVPTGTVRRHADQILLQKQNRYSLSRASDNDKDDVSDERSAVTMEQTPVAPVKSAEPEPSAAAAEPPTPPPVKTIELRPRRGRPYTLNID